MKVVEVGMQLGHVTTTKLCEMNKTLKKKKSRLVMGVALITI